jgi:hypothetical protein
VDALPGIERVASPGWHSWQTRPCAPPARGWSKLYVCPHAEEAAEGAVEVARAFVRTEAAAFKLGRGEFGLLRPDKLVAYFDDHAAALSAADLVTEALRGVAVQRVPFTQDYDGTGLVAFGADPPHRDHALPWEATSWRRTVTDRLALALLAGHRAGDDEPWRHALVRARRAGIDTRTWAPRG